MKKLIEKIGIIFCLFLWLVDIINPIYAQQSNKDVAKYKKINKIMSSMSDKQMIGQLFMIDSYANYDEKQLQKIYKQLDSNYIGGICFFKGNTEGLLKLNKLYNKRSLLPLFIAIDAEWGLNMRLNDATTFPMAMTIGALPKENYDLVHMMGENIALQCNKLGIDINFAPVCDINSNADNPVINMRSFSQSKYDVALLSREYITGLQNNNVMACLKHFPGHGDTQTDSHKLTPVILHSKDYIDSVDTYPFRYNKDLVWSLMVGHLVLPALSQDTDKVATINKDIIEDYLRNDVEFDGLVFTDAMNMKGLTSNCDINQACVEAILAGADIILMPENIDMAVNAVKKALDDGTISKKLLEQKCRKILLWKYRLGLFDKKKKYEQIDKKTLHDAEEIAYKIYEKSITSVLKNENTVNINNDNDTIILISVSTNSTYDTLINELQKVKNVIFKQITSNKKEDIQNVLEDLPKNKKVYTLVSGTRFANSTTYYGIKKDCFNILSEICNNIKDNNFLILFANAYVLKYIDTTYSFDDILVAYENNYLSQKAVANVLLNPVLPKGNLPVESRKEHIYFENQIVDNKIDFDLLSTMNIDKNIILEIDSIANNGIEQKAYPGCQVLIAKDNTIIFDKNYGFYTYDSLTPVNDNTIYDIASVSKVMATTIAVMKLWEDGKINLDAQIKKYVPQYKRCKFGKLTIKELLSHYTTLPATYPFWIKTLKDGKLNNDLYDYNVFMDENYIPVTDSLFIKKSYLEEMKKQLKEVKLKDKQYTYSDLNFLLLQYAVENITQQSLDKFLYEQIYKKLNLTNTFFNPLLNGVKQENIAPTEYDTIFRHQLIQGTVHDPMAALNGGICGNAGVFSNAHDIYKICQMLLNNGKIDTIRILDSLTIATFNQRYFADKNIRRALGFDKPFISSVNTHCSKYASQNSYGHSGFTGTYIWIDPDNNTIFIFLSNRVNPSANPNKLATLNIRTDIHDLIYKAINNENDRQ